MIRLHAWKQRNEWWPLAVLLLAVGISEPLVEFLVTWSLA